jgi:hypothetical protein
MCLQRTLTGCRRSNKSSWMLTGPYVGGRGALSLGGASSHPVLQVMTVPWMTAYDISVLPSCAWSHNSAWPFMSSA